MALEAFNIEDAPIGSNRLPFDRSTFVRRLFRRQSAWWSSFRFYHEGNSGYSPSVLSLSDWVYLDGYFQAARPCLRRPSQRYFSDQVVEIRKELAIKEPPSGKNLEALDAIREAPSASVHLRRGDYVSNPRTLQPNLWNLQPRILPSGGRPGFRQERTKAGFPCYFFSDDPEWARENLDLGHPTRFMDHNGPDQAHEDIRLMAACEHHIIANSSFSWWGAWLNPRHDKIVVAPRRWFVDAQPGTEIPDNWLRI